MSNRQGRLSCSQNYPPATALSFLFPQDKRHIKQSGATHFHFLPTRRPVRHWHDGRQEHYVTTKPGLGCLIIFRLHSTYRHAGSNAINTYPLVAIHQRPHSTKVFIDEGQGGVHAIPLCFCSKYDTFGCKATNHLGRLSELFFDFALRLRVLISLLFKGANCGWWLQWGKQRWSGP